MARAYARHQFAQNHKALVSKMDGPDKPGHDKLLWRDTAHPVHIAKAQAGKTSDLVPRGSQPASSTPLAWRSVAQRNPSLQAGAMLS